MRVSKAAIENWQESLMKGSVPMELINRLPDILLDLEDFTQRELDERHTWHCTECDKTYVRKEHRCTCGHGKTKE